MIILSISSGLTPLRGVYKLIYKTGVRFTDVHAVCGVCWSTPGYRSCVGERAWMEDDEYVHHGTAALLMGHWGALHQQHASASCCASTLRVSGFKHMERINQASMWSFTRVTWTTVSGGPALFSLQTQCTFKTCCCRSEHIYCSHQGYCCKDV